LTGGAPRRSFKLITALLLGQRIRSTGSQPCREILLSPLKPWTGITAVASVPVLGAILAGTKDIPPFVFYLVETAVGAQLMRYEEPGTPADVDTDTLPWRGELRPGARAAAPGLRLPPATRTSRAS
jgi:hypothetical protein